MPRITLIGYRGTGKSTVASLLGDLLGCGWCDADLVLEKKLGCSIAELIRTHGEPHFRDEESTVLADLLGGFAGVLSTGGGVVLRPANRALLLRQARPIVWLTATADVVRGRLAADPTTPLRRPALAGPPAGSPAGGGDPLAEVQVALTTRALLYGECADLVVDTSVMPPADVARDVAAWLEGEWSRRGRDPGPPGRPDGTAS